MEQELKYYQRKVLNDREFPVQVHYAEKNIASAGYQAHWHEHIEICYILEGHWKMQLNHETIHGYTGDLIIANSNVMHQGFCDGTEVKTLALIFELSALSSEFSGDKVIFETVVRGDMLIQELMMKIHHEVKEGGMGYKLVCKGVLLQLIGHLLRNYVREILTDSDGTKRMKTLDRLNTVNQYIITNYVRPISNKELADLIHVSEDRFNHLFKEGMGVSPQQYISEVRLKKAMHLLEAGGYSATEVAEVVGFTDYNYFGKTFRKRFGCTPQQAKQNKK